MGSETNISSSLLYFSWGKTSKKKNFELLPIGNDRFDPRNKFIFLSGFPENSFPLLPLWKHIDLLELGSYALFCEGHHQLRLFAVCVQNPELIPKLFTLSANKGLENISKNVGRETFSLRMCDSTTGNGSTRSNKLPWVDNLGEIS